MSYSRADLYLVKEFDFTISDSKRRHPKPKNKFLIILGIENHDKALFCLTTSLSGISTSLIKSKINSKCQTINEGHFFKFMNLQVSNTFKFNIDTFVRASNSDVFIDSISTIDQRFKLSKKAKLKCTIDDPIMIDLLACLSKSKYIDRESKNWINQIADEIATSLQSGAA